MLSPLVERSAQPGRDSAGNDVTGSGWTQVTFADVQLAQARGPLLLSVADTIKLEYDFQLVREP